MAAEAAKERRAWMAAPERVETAPTSLEEVHLAQALLRKFWERTKDKPEESVVRECIDLISFGPDVPPDIVSRCKQIVKAHRRVFESAQNGRPLAVRRGGDADPAKS